MSEDTSIPPADLDTFDQDDIHSWFEMAKVLGLHQGRIDDALRSIIHNVLDEAETLARHDGRHVSQHARFLIDKARASPPLVRENDPAGIVLGLDCVLARPVCPCCDGDSYEPDAASERLIRVAVHTLRDKLPEVAEKARHRVHRARFVSGVERQKVADLEWERFRNTERARRARPEELAWARNTGLHVMAVMADWVPNVAAFDAFLDALRACTPVNDHRAK